MNQESIERSVEEVDQLVQEEGLNCLINNAGINVVADFQTVTAEKMIENFHTNAVAPLMTTKVMFIVLSVHVAVVDQLLSGGKKVVLFIWKVVSLFHYPVITRW